MIIKPRQIAPTEIKVERKEESKKTIVVEEEKLIKPYVKKTPRKIEIENDFSSNLNDEEND